MPATCLVNRNPLLPGSEGVLRDGCMRYGTWHGDGVGVYFYAEPEFELFRPGDGWVMLELLVIPFIRRTGGRTKGKYLQPAPHGTADCGSLCRVIAPIAMIGIHDRYNNPGTVPGIFALA